MNKCENEFDSRLILRQFYLTWLEKDMQLTEEEFLTKFSDKKLALNYDYSDKWVHVYLLVNKKDQLTIMNVDESTKTTPKTQLFIAFIIAVEALRSLYGNIIVPTLMSRRFNWINEILEKANFDQALEKSI